MTTTLSVGEAQAQLPEIVRKLTAGDEVIITVNDQPVAELRPAQTPRPQPQFGSCAGMLTFVDEDDEHLKDFQDYMP